MSTNPSTLSSGPFRFLAGAALVAGLAFGGAAVANAQTDTPTDTTEAPTPEAPATTEETPSTETPADVAPGHRGAHPGRGNCDEADGTEANGATHSGDEADTSTPASGTDVSL